MNASLDSAAPPGRPRVGFYLRYLLADSRGARGRLLFLTLCLAVGIAAVVAVGALGANLEQAVRRDAKRLLGGDLAVSGSRPLPAATLEAFAGQPAVAAVQLEELLTMAALPRPEQRQGHAASQLVELKVVSGPYPLYGRLQLRPARPLPELLADGGLVAAPELLSRLGLHLGDQLRLGDATLTLRGELLEEPDRAVSPFTLGPRVLIARDAFERTGLATFGSRIRHQVLWRLPGNPDATAASAAVRRVRSTLGGDPAFRVRTWQQSQGRLQEGIGRMQRFLGLVALLSLLIGGVGVAQSIRAFLASRLDSVALLGCLGLRPRESFALYLAQALLLGTVGSVLGGFAGLGLQLVLPRLTGGLVAQVALRFWQPAALARGLALGLATALLFALPPLVEVLRVRPLRALRRDVEPLPMSRLARAAMLVGLLTGVWLLAVEQSRSWRLGSEFLGGLLLTLLALTAGAAGLRRLAGRLARAPLPLPVRQGAAHLARPAGDALAALVALGLGALVVLGTVLVERHLTDALSAALPSDAPSSFLLDVQPDQWPGVERSLREAGATHIDSVPVVMARLSAIDGEPAREIAARRKAAGEEDWALTREQRLTYLDALPPDNQLIAGSLWSRPGVAEVSLEEDYAHDLGVGIGSHLTFDVQGVPVELVVTSLRRVEWRTFRINFFLVVEPGVLEQAPQTRLAAARLPAGAEQQVQDLLVSRFPNVTLVDVRQVLEQVAALLHRLGTGVRFLGGFSAAAGLVILFGAVAASSVRRGREAALLKTLGFTRLGVLAVFGSEYALIGLVAALIGTAAASGLTWAVVTRGMELEWHPFAGILALSVVAVVALTVIAGLAASAGALTRPPVEVLRRERE